MTQTAVATTQVQFKGKMFSLTVLHIQGNDMRQIEQQLQKFIQQAPKMFEHAPIIIDLEAQAEINLLALTQLLRQHKLLPIGIISADTIRQQAAIQLGLALFPSTKSQRTATSVEPTVKPQTTAAKPTKVIYQPVRSGQQIYAKDADLIVIAGVSHGAEVVADGNIHIYGTLHGRAIAGANGNQQARIFCRKLDAELISIAGIYQLSDDFLSRQSEMPMQVYLENEKLYLAEL